MRKNDTLKNGTSRIGLYGCAPPVLDIDISVSRSRIRRELYCHFLMFSSSALIQQDPAFKKPLFRNESKPVSYTVRILHVLMLLVSCTLYLYGTVYQFV